MGNDSITVRRAKNLFIRQIAAELATNPDAYLLGVAIVGLIESGEDSKEIHRLVDIVIDEITMLLKKRPQA